VLKAVSPGRILLKIIAIITLAGGFSICASAQIAETPLPEILTDANGVEITTGRLRLTEPLVGFGEGIEPRVDFDVRYPLLSQNYSWCCDVKAMIRGGTDPINRGYISPCCGQTYGSEINPSGFGMWDTLTFAEQSTGTGIYFKKPAGGVFNVPFYNGHYTNQQRSNLGTVDRYGNIYKSGGPGIGIYERANGEIWRIQRQSNPLGSGNRLRNITTSRGFFIQYEYEREAAPTIQAEVAAWRTVKRISAASLAHVYCNTASTAICQNAVNEGNHVTFDYTDGVSIIHANGVVSKYKLTTSGGLEVSSPGTNRFLTATRQTMSQCNGDEYINQLTSAGATWTYAYVCFEGEQGNDWNLTRTNPAGGKLRVSGITRDSVPELYQDELLQVHGFNASPVQGYTGYSPPGGGRQYITRDLRNNIIEAGVVSKDNTTTLVTYSASFPATCANFFTCNQPTWTRDGKGNQTDFTYDPTHGGILTETGPADVNGVRPQKRYEYSQRYAWLKNSSGGYSQAATSIWVRTKEEYCVSTAASGGNCAGGAADEVVTTYDYGPNSGPNNLLPRGVVVTANGQSLRTCFGYDRMGRKISETRPAANLTSCP
jgi:hypothetical protein